MTSEDPEVVALLREIRNNQQAALELQREHIAMYQHQLERVERINNRAEATQQRAAKAVKLILVGAIPLVFLLLALMFWPVLHRLLT